MKRELKNRIEQLGFNKSVVDISFFREIPILLLNLIINLNDQEFITYISFIVSMRRKNLIIGNEDKLIDISNLLITSINCKNTKILMDILINTNIINNNKVVEFSGLLLKINRPIKLQTIKRLYLHVKNIERANITYILQLISRTRNDYQLNVMERAILNIKKIDNRKFFDITEIILDYPNSYGLSYIDKCMNCKELMKCKDTLYLIEDYLMNSKTKEEANLVYNILINKDMLKSNNIYNVLNLIKDSHSNAYFGIINQLVSHKNIIPDLSFNYLLSSVYNAKNDYQIKSILYVLNFSNIISKPVELLYYVRKCINVKNEVEFTCLKKILIKSTYFNYNLLDDGNMVIINTIIKNEEEKDDLLDYQKICIADSYEYIYNSKYRNVLIETIINTKNSLLCKTISRLLKIKDIQELPDFLKIFNLLFNMISKDKLDLFIFMLNQEKVINSYYLIDLIYSINKIDDFYIEQFKNLINKLSNLNDIRIINLLNLCIEERDFKKYRLLYKITYNCEILGLDKALNYANSVKTLDTKDYKEMMNELNNLITGETNNYSDDNNVYHKILKIIRK